MRFLAFLSLLFFSGLVSAACTQDFVTGDTSTEPVLMRVSYDFAPNAQIVGRSGRRMLVFTVYPLGRVYDPFESQVRIAVNGNGSLLS